ncbi:AlpA family phage regulatory protein [Stenotrophomonas sp.]|uniref:helix-turn-helix transcriptional regulator n=1 Tax=Stenotrophomonas sp. TaxID=69392 RepID=UPI00289B1FFD|nr:AlpA family phage regulatory protein [Stenotrophomonas sp.]
MGAAEIIPEVQLRIEQVEAQTGMKKSYIYREMAKGTFPLAHKVGSSTRWYQSDVQRWIAAQSAAPRWEPGNAGDAANSDASDH